MPLTPKGYCDIDSKNDGDESDDEAEMPLTPKGYCDRAGISNPFCIRFTVAEMPLTPKGYCDTVKGKCSFQHSRQGRNAPNAERLL